MARISPDRILSFRRRPAQWGLLGVVLYRLAGAKLLAHRKWMSGLDD